MFDFELRAVKNEPESDPECKGQNYRCRLNTYISVNSGDVVESIKMVPLIRKSCSGCEKCEWLIEYLTEDMSSLSVGDSVMPDDLEHDALYTLAVVDSSTDWETGICDDVTIGFKKTPENKNV